MLKKIGLTVVLLVVALEASALTFQENRSVHESIIRVSQETLNSEYEKAILHARNLILLYPGEPYPRFLLTTIYMYLLRSYWDFPLDQKFEIYKKEFQRAAADAKKTCDEFPHQDAMVHFVRGMVLGTEAMVHLQDKEWLDSYSKGRSGVRELQKSLEMDPGNYDAYLGLGMFEYYCSKLSGVIKVLAWIVGFSGDSEKGLQYVVKAMNQGRYAEGPAKVFLAYALIEFENKLDQGVELAKSLRSQYPSNYLFIEYLLRAANKLPPERALDGLDWIDTFIKTPNWRKEVNLFVPYNLDMVDYVEARLHLARGDYVTAQKVLEPVSARSVGAEEFSADVNLMLLSIYTKTENRDKARQLYALIMKNKSINRSHSKAKEIYKG